MEEADDFCRFLFSFIRQNVPRLSNYLIVANSQKLSESLYFENIVNGGFVHLQ